MLTWKGIGALTLAGGVAWFMGAGGLARGTGDCRFIADIWATLMGMLESGRWPLIRKGNTFRFLIYFVGKFKHTKLNFL